MAVADSFVMAAAIAQATDRVRLGMLVTPLARRGRGCSPARPRRSTSSRGAPHRGCRPWPRHPGRAQLVLGRGLDPVQRAVVLDESLEVLVRLWSGTPVDFEGERISGAQRGLPPAPVQQPLPIWVACRWPESPAARPGRRLPGLFPDIRRGRLRAPGPRRTRAGRGHPSRRSLGRGPRTTSTSSAGGTQDGSAQVSAPTRLARARTSRHDLVA